MTKSEDIADRYFREEENIVWEKNGSPDRWWYGKYARLCGEKLIYIYSKTGRKLDKEVRLHFNEYKYNNQKLTQQQRFIRRALIKSDIHYMLTNISRDWKVEVVYDSDLHIIE